MTTRESLRPSGSFTLVKSDPFFADNNLGSGAIVKMQRKINSDTVEISVKLDWLDWNYCQWEVE